MAMGMLFTYFKTSIAILLPIHGMLVVMQSQYCYFGGHDPREQQQQKPGDMFFKAKQEVRL